MLKHEDYCTLIENPEDRDILTRKLFDVNLRLYQTSRLYRHIVIACATYIRWCAMTKKDGYKQPHGYSGANAGIPFNIIATADGRVFLNPKILSATGKRYSYSNCGSLRLTEPIQIERYETIQFDYWDTDGVKHVESGYLPTIQHEIDHNNGVLITDRKAVS